MSSINSLSVNNLILRYQKMFQLLNQRMLQIINLIDDFKQIKSISEADKFFEKYGIGNSVSHSHYPFERQEAYELLLCILKEYDAIQYFSIHKGTPYYFIGWTAYQYKDFSKSLFYMDAAVSEDLKQPNVKDKIASTPSLDFFLLNNRSIGSGISEHLQLRDIVSNNLDRFNNDSPDSISIEDFCDKFATYLLYSGRENRSILTALYCFLLDYELKKLQVRLRSDNGGSIQSFLVHLFDGARVLESLLGLKCKKGSNLQQKIENNKLLNVNKVVLRGNKKLIEAEKYYDTLKSEDAPFQDYNFAAAYIIRNTTGHSLVWSDQFYDERFYTILYESLVNSILYTIKVLYVGK